MAGRPSTEQVGQQMLPALPSSAVVPETLPLPAVVCAHLARPAIIAAAVEACTGTCNRRQRERPSAPGQSLHLTPTFLPAPLILY